MSKHVKIMGAKMHEKKVLIVMVGGYVLFAKPYYIEELVTAIKKLLRTERTLVE